MGDARQAVRISSTGNWHLVRNFCIERPEDDESVCETPTKRDPFFASQVN